jgi:outer membrane protein TolC
MWLLLATAAAGSDLVELTLDEALDRLRADGPALIQAEARAEQAHALSQVARAFVLPMATVSGGYVRNDQNVVIDFGSLSGGVPPGGPTPDLPRDVVIQPLDAWTATATARVPLIAAGGWAESTGAARAARSAEATAEAIALDLEQALVGAAATADAAEAIVLAAEHATETADAHVRSIETAVVAGTATNLDLLSARATAAARRSNAKAATAERDELREQLGSLLGIGAPVRIALPEPPPDEPSRPLPELAAVEAGLAAANARVDAAALQFVPEVAAYGRAEATTQEYITGKTYRWMVGVEATLPLFVGGARSGRLAQARAERTEADAVARSTRDDAERAVRQAEREVELALAQLDLAQEQATLANEAAESAGQGLEVGTTSPLQARDAETEAFLADVSVAGARARLLVAMAALRRAKGQDQRW